MDRSWIDKFADGARVPGEAIAGLSREELNAAPIPGTWSIQQSEGTRTVGQSAIIHA